MKTLIAVPCFEKMDTPFVESLIHMNLVGDCEISFLSGTLVYDARNRLAERAVKQGFDYVLWLDSDMVFEPDLMERLFGSIDDYDLLSGLYFSRKEIIKPVILKRCRANVIDGAVHPDDEIYWEYPQEARFPIEGCGFGAVLMKTSLLKDVYDNFGLPFAPVYGFGEDLAFCMKARLLNKTMYCDSSIRLGHVRYTVSDEQLYLLSRTAAKQS